MTQNEKIKKGILDISDYKFENDIQSVLKLLDPVLLYNDGMMWKIIDLKISLTFPFVYDLYYDGDTKYDITITLCPISLRAVMLKGKFKFEKYEGTKMILNESTNKDENNIIPIDIGYKIDKKYVVRPNKRTEVKLLTLRDAIILAPDVLTLIITNKDLINNKQLMNSEYYLNNKDIENNEIDSLIHPKTLVYLIQYGTDEKTTILVGKNASKNEVTGYNIKLSGINEYLIKKQNKLIKNEAYIMPILWYIAKKEYLSAKIIMLN